jgi:hypothetical protein
MRHSRSNIPVGATPATISLIFGISTEGGGVGNLKLNFSVLKSIFSFSRNLELNENVLAMLK